MGLPSVLKNFNCWVDGEDFLGEMEEVALGAIKEKTEDIEAGGLLGPIAVGMGLDKFEAELKSAGLAERLLARFGRVGVASTLMIFRGAYQEDVAGAVKPAELVLRGRIPEIDPGSAKMGQKTSWSVKFPSTYLKWTVAGRELLEIDWLNCIYRVNGEDRYAEINAALGR